VSHADSELDTSVRMGSHQLAPAQQRAPVRTSAHQWTSGHTESAEHRPRLRTTCCGTASWWDRGGTSVGPRRDRGV